MGEKAPLGVLFSYVRLWRNQVRQIASKGRGASLSGASATSAPPDSPSLPSRMQRQHLLTLWFMRHRPDVRQPDAAFRLRARGPFRHWLGVAVLSPLLQAGWRNGDRTPLERSPSSPYIKEMKPLRTLLASAVAVTLLALPAAAEKIPLSEISRYLNSLTTAQSDFTQVNPDGTVSTGRLMINRPGRARFEYAQPDNSVVMAGGGQVAIFDAKSNQPPEQYPLSRTPLSIILAQNVDLGRARMVVGHQQVENTTHVVAQDPANPEYGTIDMVFTPSPTELRQWIITDGAGAKTTVILGELAKGAALPSSLFSITLETQRRGR